MTFRNRRTRCTNILSKVLSNRLRTSIYSLCRNTRYRNPSIHYSRCRITIETFQNRSFRRHNTHTAFFLSLFTFFFSFFSLSRFLNILAFRDPLCFFGTSCARCWRHARPCSSPLRSFSSLQVACVRCCACDVCGDAAWMRTRSAVHTSRCTQLLENERSTIGLGKNVK